MIQENGGMIVNEYQLFHGTKASTIDAICRRGFDWRFCGKHGTAYGHGQLNLLLFSSVITYFLKLIKLWHLQSVPWIQKLKVKKERGS